MSFSFSSEMKLSSSVTALRTVSCIALMMTSAGVGPLSPQNRSSTVVAAVIIPANGLGSKGFAMSMILKLVSATASPV